MEYVDGPGRIGKIGTVLGNAGISVESMQIAQNPARDTAIVFMNVDQNVNVGIRAELAEVIDDCKNAWFIDL